MNKQSHRHHYIPQFYLNYFKNQKGLLEAYNKEADKFFTTTPKAVFVEDKRNTFVNEKNEESVFIENVYSFLESKIATVFKNFEAKNELSIEDKRFLIFFAYISKWRSPAYDESFEIAKEKLSFADLRLHFGQLDLGIEYDLEELWNNEEMQAIKRILLALQPFIYKEDYEDIFKNTILLYTPDEYSAIIGSCPFVENPNNPEVAFESFFIPVTPNYTLLYLRNENIKEFAEFWKENYRSIVPLFSNLRDLSYFG